MLTVWGGLPAISPKDTPMPFSKVLPALHGELVPLPPTVQVASPPPVQLMEVSSVTTNFRTLSAVSQFPIYWVPSRMVLARSPVTPSVALIRLYVPALQETPSAFSSRRLPFTVKAPVSASRASPFFVIWLASMNRPVPRLRLPVIVFWPPRDREPSFKTRLPVIELCAPRETLPEAMVNPAPVSTAETSRLTPEDRESP